ncbi:MAG: hypothetical protein DRH24_12420 [Deltaproteobacteria bacterium]|nr:MAG: hypothetical protein DRH24_12420 [Deltaproteobacteria bacterium]
MFRQNKEIKTLQNYFRLRHPWKLLYLFIEDTSAIQVPASRFFPVTKYNDLLVIRSEV